MPRGRGQETLGTHTPPPLKLFWGFVIGVAIVFNPRKAEGTLS